MKYTYAPDTTKFFNAVRESIFHGKFSQLQVDGVNLILEAFNGFDIHQLAYVLATIYHETGHTMQPVEEYGKGNGRKYGNKIDIDGKPYTTPDKLYYGRGFVQLTWRSNYAYFTTQAKKAGKNWDFLNHPELMLQDEPSIWVAKFGMANGSFTGKKLSDYFNDTKADPMNARRIINGTDQAALITTYYNDFLKGLLA
jgi:putative chitinase